MPVHPRVCGERDPSVGLSPRSPVHPRVCGEQLWLPRVPRWIGGSSPRVRGTLTSSVTLRCRPVHPRVCGERTTPAHRKPTSRFIPACAGNASRPTPSARASGSSPRVRGTLSRRDVRRPMRAGSSPRVRGTRDARRRAVTLRRFIPACAGNADRMPRHACDVRFIPACAGNAMPCRADWRQSVHPRVCGERVIADRARGRPRRGSSPRVRGTRQRSPDAMHAMRRFIPACAGNAAETRVAHRIGRFIPACAGNAQSARCTPRRRRFIPACAGNAASHARTASVDAVHPRVCGERAGRRSRGALPSGSSPRVRGTAGIGRAAVRIAGSSPRVRGTRRRRARACDARRFIPACAGNATGDAHRQRRFIPACAGNATSASASRRRGSSPRVRGTRTRAIVRRTYAVHPRVCGERAPVAISSGMQRRFIPACAGNARRSSRDVVEPTGSSPRVRGTRAPASARSSGVPVHPRVCGEQLAGSVDLRLARSVHPRVCGERVGRYCADRMPRRFIPACAGNSLIVRHADAADGRFIPACAGNARRCRMRHGRDVGSSPRVRGTRRGSDGLSVECGSSPRVRGTGFLTMTIDLPKLFHVAAKGTPISTAPVRIAGYTSVALGENRTSVSPSKSTGVRRFGPDCFERKSRVRRRRPRYHAQSRRPRAPTSLQIRSRVRAEYTPTYTPARISASHSARRPRSRGGRSQPR